MADHKNCETCQITGFAVFIFSVSNQVLEKRLPCSDCMLATRGGGGGGCRLLKFCGYWIKGFSAVRNRN